MKQKSFKELFKEAKERGAYWAASIILDFTEGLHKIMEANRVTRSDLARRLGVSPAYITKVLRGNVNPSAPQHQRWGLPSTQAQAEGLRLILSGVLNTA
jgi:predicted transcriptional regulator